MWAVSTGSPIRSMCRPVGSTRSCAASVLPDRYGQQRTLWTVIGDAPIRACRPHQCGCGRGNVIGVANAARAVLAEHTLLSGADPRRDYLGLVPNWRTRRAADARTRPSANLVRRPHTGYQSSSLACVGTRGDVIACGRQYLRIPAATTSTPAPLPRSLRRRNSPPSTDFRT